MLMMLAVWALAQAPDYDAFCDRDGNMLTREHGLALMAMLQRSGQLEAIYADAVKGNPRAKKVFETLETDYFPDIGRELAEQVSRPPCLVPALRELSRWCVPDWKFLDFLSQERPGGAKLRRAFFDGYAERIRQRGLENQLVLSAAQALLGMAVAAAVMREAEMASRGPSLEIGKQGKHIPGHPNYIPGRSPLTHPDPQGLLDRFAGTGQPVGTVPRGQPGFKERVDFGEVIGEYDGAPTTKGLIHYSKDGAHIVPARP